MEQRKKRNACGETETNLKQSNLIYEEESFKIRGALINVYKEMGSGFLESVYHECIKNEFQNTNIDFEYEPKIEIFYKNEKLNQYYIPDFVCMGKIILEIKTVKTILPEHKAQVINYLKASNLELGFLVNFNSYPKLDIHRLFKPSI